MKIQVHRNGRLPISNKNLVRNLDKQGDYEAEVIGDRHFAYLFGLPLFSLIALTTSLSLIALPNSDTV